MTQILQNGSEFGQYRVRLLLGRGGMGEVYEVEHRVLGTRHALKLLSDEVLNQEVVLDYFKNEGRVMAQLNHSGIVSVDEFGETDGHYWLRMELIEGVSTTSGTQLFTLHDYVWHQGGSLKEPEVAECMRQFLEAIGFAHEKGVVHRDLKPANILLDTEDGMKISDFGLVKVAAEDWHRSRIARSHSSGIKPPSSGVDLEESKPEVLGTFEYMSPEQKQGYADRRSDLYSVGLIGFQLLTGKERPSVKPPSRIVDGIHPGWDNWFERALENDPDERFQTAEEMCKAIPDLAVKHKPLNIKSKNNAVLPLPSQKITVRDPDIEEDDFLSAPKPRQRRKRGEEERQQRSSFGAFLPWFIILFLLGFVAAGVIYFLNNNGNTSRPTVLEPELDQNGTTGTTLTSPSVAGGKSPDPVTAAGNPVDGVDWTLSGLGLTMKWQKAGAFRMGSDPGEPGHEEKETPAVYVVISKGFWLCSTETTVDQFKQFVDVTGHQTTVENGRPLLSGQDWQPIPSATWQTLFAGEAGTPVVGVSWEDAMAFCSWLTDREAAAGRLSSGMSYSLPSEAEWEYSCRGDDPWDYPYGSGRELDSSIANFGGGLARPSASGGLSSINGLYDMHGNVFEWCRGWYSVNHAGRRISDSEGPAAGEFRTMRGGGWRSQDSECRAAYRRGAPSTHADDQTGFRIILRRH